MRFRAKTLDLIASEYAEAVADGDFERAEGWLAVAGFASQRETDSKQVFRRLLGDRQHAAA